MTNRDRKTKLLLLLFFWVVGLLQYANSLDNGFHYDDNITIWKNEGIYQPEKVADVLAGQSIPGASNWLKHHYRPMVYGSYLINYQIDRLNPWGYHLVNVHLHILMAFFAALVIGGLVSHWGVGLLGGLLFLVHPFNNEAVNYITARSSQMYALFYLMAFYCYMRFHPVHRGEVGEAASRAVGREGSWIYLVAAFVLFLLSLLSKEMAITFPLTLLLYEGIVRHPRTRGEWYRGMAVPIGFLAVVVSLYAWIRLFLMGISLSGTFIRDLTTQLATQTKLLLQTAGLFLLPVVLTVDHDVKIYSSFLEWSVVGSCAVLAGVLAWAGWWSRSVRQDRRVVSFFLLWFLVALLPVVIFPLNAMLQENRAYLAVVGLAGIMALGSIRGVEWGKSYSVPLQRGLYVAVGVLVAVYAALTLQRNAIWQDEITLWSDAVQKNPYSFTSRNNLGVAYQKIGRLDEAEEQYRFASLSDPTNHIPWYNLGNIALRRGHFDEAMDYYIRVIRTAPNFPIVYFQMGRLEERAGRWDSAVRNYKQWVRLSPETVDAHRRLADALVKAGSASDARQEYEGLLSRTDLDVALRRDILLKLNSLKGAVP